MKHLYFLCFFILLTQGLLHSQNICDPLRPMGNHCANAPLICDWEELSDYCFTMSPDLNFNGFAPLCGNDGTPDNTHWLAFYAGCSDMTFTITPEDCALVLDEKGIQVVVYVFDGDGKCTDMDPDFDVLHCHVDPGIDQPYTFDLTNLEIGHIYYLMIDGYFGSSCSYVGISLLTPCEKPQIDPWIDSISGPTLFCKGGTASYAISPPQVALNYHWFIDGLPVQFDTSNTLQITWTLPGTYELCVKASNHCVPMEDGPGLTCISVEIYEVVGVDPPPILICEGESNPNPPGIYEIHLVTPLGCDSVVTLTILEDPTIYNHLGKFILCDQDKITLSGKEYDCSATGKHELYYNKSIPPYCDSIVQFDIVCFESRIKPHDTLTIKEDMVLLDGDLGVDATGRYVTYQWYTTNGVLPDSTANATLRVRHQGTYCLVTSLYDVDSTLLCVDTVCTQVIRRTQVPGGLDCQDATLLCDLSVTYQLTMHDSITGNGPTPLCAQGGLPSNTHWFAFFAPDSTLTLTYIPTNCKVTNGQIGIQIALYQYGGNGLCVDSKAIPAVDIGCESICMTSPWYVSTSQLQPGELYYLLIDGCAGSTCDVEFRFEYAKPATPAPFTWEGDIQGAEEICANVTSVYVAPMAPLFTQYLWSINDTFLTSTTEPSVPITWNEGGDYNLCVTIQHPCLDSLYDAGEHCYSVKVNPGVKRSSRDVYLCKDDLTLSQGAWWRCDFEGQHQTTYQQKLDPQCDSTVHFNVICLSPEVTILPPEPLPPEDTLFILDGSSSYPGPPGASVRWEWTAYNGGVIEGPNDQPTAIAKNNGLYCLTIEASSPNGSVQCTDTDCIQIGSLREDPGSPVDMMRLFPLPASDIVWVHFDENISGPGKLLFFNSLGQVVHRIDKNTSNSLLEVNVSNWPAGLYTVSFYMEQDKEIVTKRMLVVQN